MKAFFIAITLLAFSSISMAYTEEQRVRAFHKHEQHKKQQHKKRLAAAAEQKRIRRLQKQEDKRARRSFIAAGRNKKSNVDKYESQYLREKQSREKKLQRLAKQHAKISALSRSKKMRSLIDENTEFDINSNWGLDR